MAGGDTTAVRTMYAYDSRGNLGWTITPEGYGHLMEEIDGYDLEEHDYAFFRVRPDDGFAFKYCYVYERDSRGRVVSKHLPGKAEETFTYDGLDRVVTSQDGNQRAKGITIHYEYDGIGRLVGKTAVKAGVPREMGSAVYDPYTGLKTSESVAKLTTDGWIERTPSLFRTYEYDSEERVTRIVENDGDNVHTTSFTYDLAAMSSVSTDIRTMRQRPPTPSGSHTPVPVETAGCTIPTGMSLMTRSAILKSHTIFLTCPVKSCWGPTPGRMRKDSSRVWRKVTYWVRMNSTLTGRCWESAVLTGIIMNPGMSAL